MADLTYEVCFKGVASPTLRAAFADCDLGVGAGVTWVRCPHAELFAVIARIEEFGLEFVNVRLLVDHSVEPDGRPQRHPDP